MSFNNDYRKEVGLSEKQGGGYLLYILLFALAIGGAFLFIRHQNAASTVSVKAPSVQKAP